MNNSKAVGTVDMNPVWRVHLYNAKGLLLNSKGQLNAADASAARVAYETTASSTGGSVSVWRGMVHMSEYVARDARTLGVPREKYLRVPCNR